GRDRERHVGGARDPRRRRRAPSRRRGLRDGALPPASRAPHRPDARAADVPAASAPLALPALRPDDERRGDGRDAGRPDLRERGHPGQGLRPPACIGPAMSCRMLSPMTTHAEPFEALLAARARIAWGMSVATPRPSMKALY